MQTVIRRYLSSAFKFSGVVCASSAIFLQGGGIAFAADHGHDAGDHPFTPERIAKAAQWKAPHAPDSGAMPGVKQGPFDDSWFESSLCALVRTEQGRAQVTKIISQTTPGHYLVRFPGRPSSVVAIRDEQIEIAKLANKADWANILEMAVAKLYPQIKQEREPGSSSSVTQSGLTLLTGAQATAVKLSEQTSEEQQKDLLNHIDRCFHDSMPMISTTKGEKELSGKPLPPNCTFALVECDRKTKTIVLRNPFANDVVHQKNVTQKVDQTIGGVTNLGGGCVRMPIKTWIDSFVDLSSSNLP